jgi:hypothetical protein
MSEVPVPDALHARRLRRCYLLLVVAVASAVATMAASLWFLLAAPSAGTRSHDVLGISAAASGIATGILFAWWGVYASSRRIWPRLPRWLRFGVVSLLGVVVALSLLIAGD